MVVICETTYDQESYDEFKKYDFELDDFQKHALKHYLLDNHVLITAHTGSGKTLPAEFAILQAHKNGKKSIYTAPIKSLSNQKFNEFTEKYPHISFGILTGDIKYNPEADCLIMTTEILRNTLFQKQNREIQKDILSFNMNIDDELECVIFDEVHYINDADRGKVWEESIMMMSTKVKMVMLSATINNIEGFASWVETTTKRNVAICSTNKRVVPLTHYAYLTFPKSFYKDIGNQEATQIQSTIENPLVIKENKNFFNEENITKLRKIKNKASLNCVYTKPSFVLKNIVTYLNEHDLLPAICFVFSRKNVEKYAKQLNINLIQNVNEVEKICTSILKRIPNYKEFMETGEYKTMIDLLKRGIAIHHSGILPILREMVELLFSKGCIKVLFATETFAVGVNMPAKTVLFTSLQKYTSNDFRCLLSHEYTQMAGRAGRRGLDKIGVVIHLLNIFNEMPTNAEYKHIVDGNSQQLVSKFKIHSNLLLRIIYNNQDTEKFIVSSMITNEINNEYNDTEKHIIEIKEKRKTIHKEIKYYMEIMEYTKLINIVENSKNKKRTRALKDVSNYEEKNHHVVKEYEKYKKIQEYDSVISKECKNLDNINNYVKHTTDIIISHLIDDKFLQKNTETNKLELTRLGIYATHIQEVHSLMMASLLYNNSFDELTSEEIAAFFSIFTLVKIGDKYKKNSYDHIKNQKLNNIIQNAEKTFRYFYDFEVYHMIQSDNNLDIMFDIVEEVYDWCYCKTEQDCRTIIERVKDKGMFAGEFTKAVLKINNISSELEKICNLSNNMGLLQKLQDIKKNTMKYIVSNQSLYLTFS